MDIIQYVYCGVVLSNDIRGEREERERGRERETCPGEKKNDRDFVPVSRRLPYRRTPYVTVFSTSNGTSVVIQYSTVECHMP